jgi:hypothetical protein
MSLLDITKLFECKELSSSSIETYKTKLRKLNDNKPIKNINFLLDFDNVKDKIKDFKPNTQRTYYIAICSILKCIIHNKQANKKIIKAYEDYSKILDDYNMKLKDQTAKTDTENKNWVNKDDMNSLYEELEKNKDKSNQDFQNYMILSLYYLQAPRRNKDYALMKVVNKYNDKLSNEYNYLDLSNKKFIFNNYKTAKKYNQQEQDIPLNLMNIINDYINHFKIKNNDFLITNLKTNEPLKNTNSMTLLLNRIFKKNVGSSMLRKVYLTNKYGDQAQELIKDVSNMGTSTQTAQNNYIKK